MNHPDREVLLGFADGEIYGIAANDVERHVAVCDACAATLASIREVAGMLALAVSALDRAEPAAWQHAVYSPRPQRAAAVLPAESGPRVPARPVAPGGARSASSQPRRSAPSAWRWAAGIVLVAAAGGSAAVIAIPELTRLVGERASPPSPAAVDVGSAPAAAAGVHVAARQGRVEVALTGVAPGTRLRVELVAGDEAGVHVAGEGTARFLARDGRIDADLGGERADVTVSLPRELSAAEILVAGVVAVRVADGRVTPSEAAAQGITLDW